jgi:hypothetical protein
MRHRQPEDHLHMDGAEIFNFTILRIPECVTSGCGIARSLLPCILDDRRASGMPLAIMVLCIGTERPGHDHLPDFAHEGGRIGHVRDRCEEEPGRDQTVAGALYKPTP